MSYDNTNSGVIFRNEDKTRENHPDHKGSSEIKCPCCGAVSAFWLSAWVKTAGPNAKNPGSKFFSLAFQPKDEAKTPRPAPKANSDDDQFDDIPF